MASVFKKIKKFFGGILRFLGKFSGRFPPAIHFGRISRNYHARLIFKAILFPVSVWHYFWIKINSALISEEKLPCEFAVAAIVKNEAPYIAEWIRYYKLLGADKIILYDNNSTDNLKSVLNEFIRSGFVDYRAMGGGGAANWTHTTMRLTNTIKKYGTLHFSMRTNFCTITAEIPKKPSLKFSRSILKRAESA